LAIAAALLFFPQACKKAEQSAKTVEVAIQAGPITLDPRLATDAEGSKICDLIFDGLMKRDDDLNLVPGLAEKMERLSDTSFLFHLRRGVFFHSGAPFTARDVVYTYKSIINGNIASAFRRTFSRIKDMAAQDDYTVRMDLKEVFAPYETLLTMGIVSEADAEKLKNRFGTNPVGTGPYKLVRLKPESVVELEANPLYFGNVPKTRFLRFHVVKDDNIRVLKLIKGDVDLVQNGIPPLILPRVLESKDMEMDIGDGLVTAYLGMNLTNRFLKDVRVRRAIAHAIDRGQIIEHRLGGLAVEANSILSPFNWAYDSDLSGYSFDQKKARALLEEAGYKTNPSREKGLSFTYKTSAIKERIDMARMIAHQLAEVGIDVKVLPYEWGTFYNDIKRGNFQLYSLSWVGITEPDFLYEVAHSSQVPPAGLNRDRYKNPVVDALVEKGRITMNEKERKTIYKEVQRILLEDLPFIPLWYEKNVVVYRKSLSGVKLRPDASYLTFVNIEKE
jgi:peptide/nickel transport system substrate-binding protein